MLAAQIDRHFIGERLPSRSHGRRRQQEIFRRPFRHPSFFAYIRPLRHASKALLGSLSATRLLVFFRVFWGSSLQCFSLRAPPSNCLLSTVADHVLKRRTGCFELETKLSLAGVDWSHSHHEMDMIFGGIMGFVIALLKSYNRLTMNSC